MSFNAETTAEEVLRNVDLSGKLAFVTGGAVGIGLETSRALASVGASVILGIRDKTKGENALTHIKEKHPEAEVSMMEVELGSFKSIEKFAEEFLAKHDSLNLLINNAGIMACPQMKTDDGLEMQFGVNHIGHFLLTMKLMPALKKGTPSRVVNLSSGGHRRSDINWDDINYETRPYDKFESYGQSKTANILFSQELHKRFSPEGVSSYSVHPGMIMGTELSRHMVQEDFEEIIARTSKADGGKGIQPKTVEAGAATTVWAATSEDLAEHGGSYLEDCHVGLPMEGENPASGYATYALNPESAERLWRISEEITGQAFS